MLLIALIWLLILLFKLYFSLRMLRAPARRCQGELEAVTVIQPILSGDPALETVLASTVEQLHGAAFFWLIDEDDAEAARVTQCLQQRYPQQHIAVFSFPQAPEGVNPKLFKLEQVRA